MPLLEFQAVAPTELALKEVLSLAARGACAEQLLQALAQAACLLGGEGMRSAIFTRSGPDTLELRAAVGLKPPVLAAIQRVAISPDQLSSGRAAASGKPAIIEDIFQDPRLLKWMSLSLQNEICAAWSFPLLTGKGEVLGSLTLYPSRRGRPSEALRAEIGYFADVATLVIERQQLQETAERRQRLHETFLKNTPDTTFVYDLDKRLVYANDALLRIWGKRADEIIGRTLRELGYPEWEAQWHEGELDEVIATRKSVQGEAHYQGSKGLRLYDYVLVPVIGPDGHLEAIAGSGRDITERRAMEDALHASQAHLASLFEQTAVGIVELGLDGRLLRCNGHFCQLMGLGPHMVTATHVRQLVHADDLKPSARQCAQLKDSGASVQIGLRLVRADARLLWVNASISLIKGEDKRSSSLLAVVQDNTALRAHEEELQQASRRKDEFLAMLAHELRNPLAPIACGAELLASGLDLERSQEVGELIQRQAQHLSALVDDLLDVSRVTRGLVRLRMEPVDLVQVARDAVEQARPLLDERRHDIEMQIDHGTHLVLGDSMRLVQVTANLLNNAAKYTPEGGRICVVLKAEPGYLDLSVRDNGIGMPPELLARAFDLFVQDQRSCDRSHGGLGLGLALVKSLVELHGGSVVAHSAGIGRGTEVSMRLPRKAMPDISGESEDAACYAMALPPRSPQ